MRKVITAGVGLMLAACQLAPTSDAHTLDEAMRQVRARLHSPSSARFRAVRIAPQQTGAPAVCGQVSARNAAGAYSDFQRLYVQDGDVGLEPLPDGAEAAPYLGGSNGWNASHLRFCTLAGGAMSPPPPPPAS